MSESSAKAWALSPKVVRVLRAERISSQEFSEMLRLSAPFRHEVGNRRFMNWAILVQGDDVLDLVEVDPPVQRGAAFRSPHHLPCEGKGCRGCNYYGVITRFA